MTADQEKRVAEAPESVKNIVRRAYEGANKSTAIKAFCLQCVGYVRADVSNCTATACPLYFHRPYQVGQNDPARLPAARDDAQEALEAIPS